LTNLTFYNNQINLNVSERKKAKSVCFLRFNGITLKSENRFLIQERAEKTNEKAYQNISRIDSPALTLKLDGTAFKQLLNPSLELAAF